MEKSLISDIDLFTARKITLNQAKEYKVLPLYEKDNTIHVASIKDNDAGEDFIRFLTGRKVRFIYVSPDEIIKLIKLVLVSYEKLEDVILKEAVKMKSSDVHFEPSAGSVKVRYRIDGSLILMRKLMMEEYLKVLSRIKVNANMDITERRKAQDGKIIIEVDGEKYNCRIATMPLIGGEKLVIRIIYEDKYKKLSSLNFTQIQKEKIKKIISVKNGLTIINGPTGSGKTTTLYSLLGEIKSEQINITTLEDPVEITMEDINQINLNPKAGITFSSGLRGILRQDPDVIMIGEIRDEETARMAVRSAITGHKVYSTIHTKSPREVYLRLEEMGVKPYLIRSALAGVVSQRLIGVLCDNCKKKIGEKIINCKKVKIYKKCGCNKCNNTGIKGRTLVSAVHYVDKELRESIKNIYDEENLLSNEEMKSVLDRLLCDGKIDYYDYLEFLEGEELDEREL